jgi:hypothetical protein
MIISTIDVVYSSFDLANLLLVDEFEELLREVDSRLSVFNFLVEHQQNYDALQLLHQRTADSSIVQNDFLLLFLILENG